MELKDLLASGTFPDVALMTPEEVAALLPNIDFLLEWGKGVKEYALKEAQKGVEFPGFKVVEGRSTRVIRDQDELVKRLTGAGYQEAVIFEPKKLLSLTALEKVVGRAKFSEIAGGLMSSSTGKPTLVPADDPRPAYSVSTAQNDFK